MKMNKDTEEKISQLVEILRELSAAPKSDDSAHEDAPEDNAHKDDAPEDNAPKSGKKPRTGLTIDEEVELDQAYESVMHSDGAKIVLVANEDEDGSIGTLASYARGKGNSVLALVGVLVHTVLKKLDVRAKEFAKVLAGLDDFKEN